MKSKKRIAILGPADTAGQCAAQFAVEYDITLTTDQSAELLTHTEEADLEAAALCTPEAPLAEQLDLAQQLLEQGLTVLLLRPSVPHGIEGLGLVRHQVDGRPLLALPARPIGHRPSLGKRLFDIVFSAAVLLLGFPLWLLIALAIKLRDRGPVFFVQDRVGVDGRHFGFIKFRTMWPDADAHRAWYESQHGKEGHVFKLRDDPRRTPVGRVLRRFSLDEAPQFWHALVGQMSVVGPRPPLPSEVVRYRDCQRMRLSGWFGLTGLWQVCGRSEIRDLDDIVLLDALYLHNHTVLLDLHIILRTLHVVLAGRGAY